MSEQLQQRIAELEADYKQLDVLYGEEFNRNNVLVGERAALRQQLLVAQAEVKRLREALQSMFSLNPNATYYTADKELLTTTSDTSLIDALQRDAERYRWLKENGNAFYNCIQYRAPEKVDAAIDAAIQEAKP